MPTVPEALAIAVEHHQAGRLQHAEQIYRRVLQAVEDHPDALHLLGVVAHQVGEHQVAVERIRRAIAQRPDDANFFSNLGAVYRAMGQLDEAVTSYERALRIDPAHAESHYNLGLVLKDQGNPQEAVSSFRRAAELKPDYAAALASLSQLLEHSNRAEEAAELAAKCLRLVPDHRQANLVVATCEAREGRRQEAIARLEEMLRCSGPGRGVEAEIKFRLGRLYDRTGETAKAFECFVEANRLIQEESGEHGVAAKQNYLRNIDTLSRVFTRQWVDSWTAAVPFDERKTPVFLVGFPRSGTTLLDVILDSHPRIQVLEERPTFFAMAAECRRVPGEFPQSIARLTPRQIEAARNAYFREVDRFLKREPDKLLIDKHPMNTDAIGLILRIFPNARVIFMVRHPCDVCLSCFMRNFTFNPAVANFLTLEDTAIVYDKIFRLWRQFVQLLPHSYHLVRYEDLVGDFQAETRRLLQFLGAEWNDAVCHYWQHARQLGWIGTASYDQVTQPIYRRACYRWRRYAEYLQPIVHILKPHIEYFGYAENS